MNTLDISEPIKEDISITKWEERSYSSFNTNTLKNSEEIRIPINNVAFVYPHDSTLQIEGKFVNFKPEASNKSATISRNFGLHLFSEIRFEVNGVVIDSIRSPGIATSMINWLTIGAEDHAEASLHLWLDSKVEFTSEKTQFWIHLPLKKMLSFFQDYRKIIIFSRLELILIRAKSDVDCIIEQVNANSVNIEITKISWKMPHLEINEMLKLKIMKILESGRSIQMAFRSHEYYENPSVVGHTSFNWVVKTSVEKPIFVVVGFQTNRRENKALDPSFFDTCKVRNVRLFLNSQQFPYENFEVNFDQDNYSVLYRAFLNFRKKYLNTDSASTINFNYYATHCPLVVFNTSHTDPVIKSTPIDIRLEFEFHSTVPKDTNICLLIIQDTVVNYQPLTGTVLR